jgi:hypothetical protein
MASTGYVVNTGTIALAAATAKTCLNVIAPAQFGLCLVGFEISFDGVTASAVPVLVEIAMCSQAGAGTPAGSPPTPVQIRGQTVAHGCTIGHNYSAEPTVITPSYDWWIDPNKGVLDRLWPLGREFEQNPSKGIAVRCTAPATVNVRVSMEWERI